MLVQAMVRKMKERQKKQHAELQEKVSVDISDDEEAPSPYLI